MDHRVPCFGGSVTDPISRLILLLLFNCWGDALQNDFNPRRFRSDLDEI